MTLFSHKWRVWYIDNGVHAPVYKHGTVRARDYAEALRKAQEAKPPGFRVDRVKMFKPRFKRGPKGLLMAWVGVFLLLIGLTSPAWTVRSHRVVHYDNVTRATTTTVAPITVTLAEP